MLIRPANPARDAEAIAHIYAPFVNDTVISFEDVAPTAAEMAARIERLSETHAWMVADDGGEILGYAYGCPHRERAAYRWATEVSVYVDPRHRRRGAGRALYEALFGALAEQGYRIALAGIALPNDASVALHEACGFKPVGVYQWIGFKQGRWWDVGWWQLNLNSRGGTGSQAEPEQRQPREPREPREPGGS